MTKPKPKTSKWNTFEFGYNMRMTAFVTARGLHLNVMCATDKEFEECDKRFKTGERVDEAWLDLWNSLPSDRKIELIFPTTLAAEQLINGILFAQESFKDNSMEVPIETLRSQGDLS